MQFFSSSVAIFFLLSGVLSRVCKCTVKDGGIASSKIKCVTEPFSTKAKCWKPSATKHAKRWCNDNVGFAGNATYSLSKASAYDNTNCIQIE